MLPWILAFSLSATPLQETDPGSVAPSTAAATYSAEVQAITKAISNQYQAWTARDFDGYMAAFWKSPLLIYVVDSNVLIGWDNAYGHLQRQFPAGQDAGEPVLERLQVNVVSPDSAVSVEWWTVHFRGVDVHGNTSSAWKKFPEGWRAVECHTSSAEFAR
jgi:ketosteroid isomerase-like protein